MRKTSFIFGLAAALLAAPATAAPFSFSNDTFITIPDSGSADPFPSSIAVSGITNVTDINVTLFDLEHTQTADLEIFLRGPDGSVLLLLQDAFNLGTFSGTLTFDDEAGSVPSPLVPGTFAPFQLDGDVFADVTDFGLTLESELQGTLSVFDGLDPTGNWDLFIFDNGPPDGGALQEGWRITFEADRIDAVPAPSMFGIFTLALVGLGFARRRR